LIVKAHSSLLSIDIPIGAGNFFGKKAIVGFVCEEVLEVEVNGV
jgi:hypothetical protein